VPDSSRRNEKSRRAILTAAFELAGEVGYGKLSIEGIAARAGVGKQTIYRWWPSKGAVLFDAFLMMSEGETGELPYTGDIERDLKTVLRATVAELRDERYDLPMRALNTEMMHDPELARTYTERLEEPMRDMKKSRLRKAVEDGQLSDVDLDVAVDVIWGPITVRWMNRSGPLTEEFADVVVETALSGLRSPVA